MYTLVNRAVVGAWMANAVVPIVFRVGVWSLLARANYPNTEKQTTVVHGILVRRMSCLFFYFIFFEGAE